MSGRSGRVRVSSFNPYEARFPGRRVVSRDTLHLVKELRARGMSVTVEPEDGTKLNWFTQKGFEEVLFPMVVQAVDVTRDMLVGVFSAWLYKRFERRRHGVALQDKVGRPPVFVQEWKDADVPFYDLDGSRVEEDQVRAELAAARMRATEWGRSLTLESPKPNEVPAPIFLEHTSRVGGWAAPTVDERGLRVKTWFQDDETWDRVQKGELRGFSVGLLIHESACSICGSDYVDCNHVSSLEYDGEQCKVHLTGLYLAEVSVVREPVNPLALIEEIA